MFRFFLCHADEDRRQHSEYIGLDVGHQQLQGRHEDGHEDGDDAHHATHASAIHSANDEDQRHEHHDDDMSGQDVGEQTDHQCEGLGDGGDELDDRHQREGLQEDGYVGPEDVLPVVTVAEDVDEEVGQQGEHDGDAQVARHVGAEGEEGDETEQVGEEDDEEHR